MRANLFTFDELEWLPELEDEWESYGDSSASESQLVSSAIRRGTTDENSLTNLVFFRRHPERNGRSISGSERNYQTLVREWVAIRDTIVRPVLRSGAPTPPSTMPAPSTPSGLDLVTLSWSGRTFQVARQIAGNVQALLEAAANDGIQLTVNSAYRDPSHQIALRRKNCGSSDYDIYKKPSSQCTPPTARPGTSNHERGLAIDLGVSGGRLEPGTPAFDWMLRNAERNFGLKNYSKESWHWSVDGK